MKLCYGEQAEVLLELTVLEVLITKMQSHTTRDRPVPCITFTNVLYTQALTSSDVLQRLNIHLVPLPGIPTPELSGLKVELVMSHSAHSLTSVTDPTRRLGCPQLQHYISRLLIAKSSSIGTYQTLVFAHRFFRRLDTIETISSSSTPPLWLSK